jgi:hypothetical protein
MSIAFVVFQEKPEFIQSIGGEITKAIAQVEGFSGNVFFYLIWFVHHQN